MFIFTVSFDIKKNNLNESIKNNDITFVKYFRTLYPIIKNIINFFTSVYLMQRYETLLI